MALETVPIYLNDSQWLRDFRDLSIRIPPEIENPYGILTDRAREVNALIDANRWTVVNAPRPLMGYLKWQGPFRAGIFYAAGPWETFGQHWSEDNATPVVRVSNCDIQAILWDRLGRDGYTPMDYFAQGYSWAELAREKELPWRSY